MIMVLLQTDLFVIIRVLFHLLNCFLVVMNELSLPLVISNSLMFQWMKVYTQYNDFQFSWGVSFNTKLLSIQGTKCDTSAVSLSIEQQDINGFIVHTSFNGTSFILGIGY